MSTAEMAQWLEETEKFDPITPQLIQSQFKNDSRAMQSLGDRWNIEPLSEEARYNQANPEEGIANASKAAAMGFLGAGIGSALGGAGAYGAATPGVAQGGQQAAMLAAQTGEFGGYGLAKTMEAAAQAQGLPWYSQAAGEAAGLMSNASPAQSRMMMNQSQSLMNPPPQAPPPPPPPRPQQQQPMMPLYMTEEEKQRLMMQQRGFYQ
jgi:hypothetical protein